MPAPAGAGAASAAIAAASAKRAPPPALRQPAAPLPPAPRTLPRRPRQVALAGAHDHVLLQAEVAYHNPAALDLRQGPVAAVDDLPHRAAHGRRAVAAARPETAARASAQAPDRQPAERGAGGAGFGGLRTTLEVAALQPHVGEPLGAYPA